MSKVDMVMPQMGESIAEGTIIKWLKKEGDKVERDEIILEISTDKVDSEIPSPESGTVKQILFSEGEVVEVGAVIAHIETKGGSTETIAETPAPEVKEEPEATTKPTTQSEPATRPDPVVQPAPTPQPTETAAELVQQIQPATVTAVTRTDPSGRKFYSPLVRNIAKTEGISQAELETVPGSGANGRVTKKDILGYLDRRGSGPAQVSPVQVQAPPTPTYTPPAEPVYSDERTEVIPMDNMRKAIAAHMVGSVKTSPHVFAISEADMTNLVRFRQANKEAFMQKYGTKLTYMPFIVQASARALVDFPLVNSSLDGDKIIRKKYINIGMAVALDNFGLIVPVIKGADGLNIAGLARAVNDVAQRARSKKLKPDDVQDGTFSITNMGVFGSLVGLPIINQPQVAILGIGTIQKRPVVINDAIAIREMMYISLSFDHRIVDGSLAAQFLERIAYYLTNFDTNSIM